MEYPIFMGRKQLGKVQVLKEGLYYRISCRCQRPGSLMYRLTVTTGDRQEKLGILAPVGSAWGLDRRVPVSRLGEGEMRFELRPSHESVTGSFAPISPEEPFAYLDRLKNARLIVKDGQMGAELPSE